MTTSGPDAASALPSAIPAHLRCPRTTGMAMPEGYVPVRGAWGATMSPSVLQVGIAYIGIQFADTAGFDAARHLMQELRSLWAGAEASLAPHHHDVARTAAANGQGVERAESAESAESADRADRAALEATQTLEATQPGDLVCMAYWRDPVTLRRFIATAAFGVWRGKVIGDAKRLGFFIELVCPKASEFETIFSTNRFEGIAAAADGEPIHGLREHGYWGSMRDRLPAAQTATLDPAPDAALIVDDASDDDRGIVVRAHDSLTLIRSGQDWSDTVGEERTCYLGQIEPALRDAMDDLRLEGTKAGCYSNRFMQHIEAEGKTVEKTFGLSYWKSLADLERWASSDPKHLKIFGSFMGMARRLGSTRLRLYHEVMVVGAGDQYFEYVGCRAGTGLLNGLRHHG